MLQANFIMICIIHKILVLLKTIRISKHFLRSIIDFFQKENNCFVFFCCFFFKTFDEKFKKLKKNKQMVPQLKIRNLFRLKMENKVIQDRIIRDLMNLFEHEED